MTANSIGVPPLQSALDDSPFPFSYADFDAWYVELSSSQLEPARQTFVRLLNQQLERDLSEFDRHRIRVAGSRVKNPGRTWTKMAKDKYRTEIKDLDSIPMIIDDLVGLRIVCNNLCDIKYIQEILSDLPIAEEALDAPLAIEPDSEKKYVGNPKPSGYRAYHINLVSLVPTLHGWKRVRGELQIRTLLQDGWGELTHEDTYKPGTQLPPLFVTLSRRMADLLATVDDLAQDIREEIDRFSATAGTAAVSGPAVDPAAEASRTAANTVFISPGQGLPSAGLPAPDAADVTATPRQALLDETRRVIETLGKPTSLAAIAQRVLSVFGSAIVPEWGGYPSFKALVKDAVPQVTILDGVPGMVLPIGTSVLPEYGYADDQEPAADDAGVPQVIRELRRYDKNLPAFDGDRLRALFRALEDALAPGTWVAIGVTPGEVGIRELNMLSRFARDAAVGVRHESVGRQHLDYFLKALLWSGNLRPGIAISQVKEILSRWLLARAEQLGLARDSASAPAEITSWLAGS